MKYEFRFTTASPRYDYHATKNLGWLGLKISDGRALRMVAIPPEKVKAQAVRYFSENCVYLDTEAMQKWAEMGLIEVGEGEIPTAYTIN